MSGIKEAAEFASQSFDPERYTKDKFIKSPIETVKDEYTRLVKDKEKAGQAMQSNQKKLEISLNHTDNWLTIKDLESDMLELRNLLTEVNSVMKGLQQLSINFDQYKSGNQKKLQTFIIKDLQSLLDLPDKLDVTITQRQFEKAVLLIESGNKLMKDNPQIESLISNTTKVELDKRVDILAELLTNDLRNPTIKSSESRKIITYLLRLGMADKAREIYLDTRSKRIEREIKKLRLEGDLGLYISDLARLVFSSINTTCEDFCSSFTQHEMLSGFIVWAIGELEKFGTIVRNQVFHNSDDFSTMGKCLEIAKLHCALLEEKGLSLSFVLTQMFYPNLVDAINTYKRKIEVNLSNSIVREQWHGSKQAIQYDNEDGTSTTSSLQLTDSARYLYTTSQSLGNNISRIITFELVPTITATLSTLFENYLIQLTAQFSHDLTDNQGLSIIANGHVMVEDLVPRIIGQLEGKLNRPVSEFDKLRKNLQILNEKLRDTYCSKRAENIVRKNLEWEKSDYSKVTWIEPVLINQKPIDNGATVSPKFIKLFSFLANLRSLISSLINQRAISPIITKILEEVSVRFSEGKFWDNFGEGGLHQFVLDMKFFAEVAREYASDKMHENINDVIDKSMLSYCKSAKKRDATDVLKHEDWFTDKIKKTIKENAKDLGLTSGTKV